MAKLPVGKRPIRPAEDEPPAEPQAAPAGDDKIVWKVTDDELLAHCREERQASIGFGEGDGGELVKRRERALNYYKGNVSHDIEDVDKRSRAVSHDLAEAIDTSMPDLIEIFLNGDDTVTFVPNGEEDEKQARSETDFVQYVLFTLNEGFVAFQSAFKDALLMSTGLFHWWWEQEEKDVTLQGQHDPQLAPVIQQITQEQLGAEITPQQEPGDDFVTFQAKRVFGKVRYMAVPPDDFTVSQDTVSLRDTPYCCLRERNRVQAFIERGLPAEKIERLPEYAKQDEQIERARDEAGESDRGVQGTRGPLRMVEIRSHYLRLDIDGDGKTEIVKVTTDFEEQELIAKEVVDHIPFSALTPYMTQHRFYGESVADRLFEIQQIKTVLLRMALDSGYFALNQRFEVAEEKASEYTLSDLLRNEPNMPVRSLTGDAVRPLTGGELGFDAFQALEYVSVMGEQRTGIMRNAQGLNPDTLHDTAHGALALLNSAQKRVRFIAKVFAETGVRDLALGIHRTLRCNWQKSMQPLQRKIGSSWASAHPSEWPERDLMEVQIGAGSREQEQATLQQQITLMGTIVEQQGGMQGPLVTAENAFAMLMAWSNAAGQKAPERFWSDPSSPQMQQAMAQKAQQPNPEQQKLQGEQQLAQAKLQGEQQMAQQKFQSDQQLAQQKIAVDGQVRQQQAAHDAALQQEQVRANAMEQTARVHTDAAAKQAEAQRSHELELAKVSGQLQLAREEMLLRMQLEREKMEGTLEIQRTAAKNKPQPKDRD